MKLIIFTTIFTACTLTFGLIAWLISSKREQAQDPWELIRRWHVSEPSEKVPVRFIVFYEGLRLAVRDMTPNTITAGPVDEPMSLEDPALLSALRALRDPRRAQG